MAVDLTKLVRRIIKAEELLTDWQAITGATDDERNAQRRRLISEAQATGVTVPELAERLVATAKAGA